MKNMKKILGALSVLALISGTAMHARGKSRSVQCKNNVWYKGEHDKLCEGLKGNMLQCCGCIVAKGHCMYEPHGGGGVKKEGGCSIKKMVKMMRPKTNEDIQNAIDDIAEHIREKAKEYPDAALPEDILSSVIETEKEEVGKQ